MKVRLSPNLGHLTNVTALALFICCFGFSDFSNREKKTKELSIRDSDGEFFLNSDWLAPRLANPNNATSILNQSRTSTPFVISDRIKVLEHLLKGIPKVSLVYPSEQYFYFRFPWKERIVSGNLRFCESANGIVHFGYFDVFDRNCIYHGALSSRVVGVDVSRSGNSVKVSVNGTEREFVLIDPKLHADPPLRKGERIVSPVLDESGFNFALVFSESIPRFLFLLDLQAPLPERLSIVSNGDFEFFIGNESRFIFFRDEDRLVLCGVLSDNIDRNNYFDGPFDQVPPNLKIRNEIESVYPYVKLRGGIDEHGNFLEQPGVRVAISPYLVYSDTSQFLKEVGHRSQVAKSKGTTFLSELVYEWKTDFLRQDSKPEPIDQGSTPKDNGKDL